MREAIDLLARAGRNELATDLSRIRAKVDFDDLEVLRCPGTERIADCILEAKSFSELMESLSMLARAMLLDHCSVHVVCEAVSTNFSTKVLTTYPEEWISRYVDRRYSSLDPVGHRALASDHGFYWDGFDRSAPVVSGFWADAAAYGIGPAGYTQPIITERGDRLAVSVSSSNEPTRFRERFERYEDDLFSLSIYLADAFCRLASEDRPRSFSPTDDQLAILRALAMGKTEAELREGNYLYGSYANLERAICELFRTKTVVQAAVLAGRIGLLADAPLTRADILATSARQAAVETARSEPLRRLVRLRSPAADSASCN